LVGPALAVVILYVRRTLPESPRWLLTHGRAAQAEQQTAVIEQAVACDTGSRCHPSTLGRPSRFARAAFTGYRTVLTLAFTSYWRRAVLGASLMISQSFLYNAIFFTYTLVLTKFYHVPRDQRADLPARVRRREPGRPAAGPAV
jgi:hypothetical protein